MSHEIQELVRLGLERLAASARPASDISTRPARRAFPGAVAASAEQASPRRP